MLFANAITGPVVPTRTQKLSWSATVRDLAVRPVHSSAPRPWIAAASGWQGVSYNDQRSRHLGGHVANFDRPPREEFVLAQLRAAESDVREARLSERLGSAELERVGRRLERLRDPLADFVEASEGQLRTALSDLSTGIMRVLQQRPPEPPSATSSFFRISRQWRQFEAEQREWEQTAAGYLRALQALIDQAIANLETAHWFYRPAEGWPPSDRLRRLRAPSDLPWLALGLPAFGVSIRRRPPDLSVYLSDSNSSAVREVVLALVDLYGEFGLDLILLGEPLISSWFGVFGAEGRSGASSPDTGDRLAALERAVLAHSNTDPSDGHTSADHWEAHAQAVARVADTLTRVNHHVDRVAIMFRSALLVQDRGGMVMLELTTEQRWLLERDPSLLGRPDELLRRLHDTGRSAPYARPERDTSLDPPLPGF
jgi:hypothetical protein